MRRDHELAALCDRSTRELSGVVSELEYLLDSDDDCQYLAIRPTEAMSAEQELFEYMSSGNWRDWLRNGRFYPSWEPATGWGHRGYQAGAKALLPFISMQVSQYKPLVLTGWSLGGGVAQPLALMLKGHGYDVRKVRTFGAPPALVKARTKFDNASINVLNYRYRNDSVPTLMRWMPYEIAAPVQLGVAGDFKDRTWRDHGIKNYERVLERLRR